MARIRHPSKEIEAAIQYAEEHGWICSLVKKGHAWGRLKCPVGDRSGCQMSVWSTPQNQNPLRSESDAGLTVVCTNDYGKKLCPLLRIH